MPRAMRVAVEGCGHGTLNAIYESIQRGCEQKGWEAVDVLIIGGDFQAVRNASDLNCMAVPVKYREIGDFHEYYSGARRAPYLTLFVGGNHEASNHLWELYYGGWVAPNIYYMGAANVLRVGPLRIAGLSGIWKGYDYRKPHFERLPYNPDDVRSIFHVRELDVRKLLQVRSQVDVGISHDWPKGVEWLGNHKWLFKKKDLFEADARNGRLGSPAAKYALDHLRPPHWFSAHLHIRYTATVKLGGNQSTTDGGTGDSNSVAVDEARARLLASLGDRRNEEEIDLGLDGAADTYQTSPTVDLSKPVKNSDEIDLDDDIDAAPEATDAEVKEAVVGAAGETTIAPEQATEASMASEEQTSGSKRKRTPPGEVSSDVLAQLPAAFQRQPSPPREPDPPTTIDNDEISFLALDKCLPNRNFLELLEINPVSNESDAQQAGSAGAGTSQEPSFIFSYDPEWLAITRAFAKEEPVQLGDPAASVPRGKGKAHYARLIEEAQQWIDDNIVAAGKLAIPQDFKTTAPVYDSKEPVTTQQTPREYTNPQTVAYCRFLDIPNAFDASKEEREARQKEGPKAVEQRGGFRGDRGGGRGFRDGGRGGRGRGRGFGGSGRGRGRDRGGRW